MMVVARADTVFSKPACCKATVRRRRCMVPVRCFFEWKRGERSKLSCQVRVRDSESFGMVGSCEYGENPETGDVIEVCVWSAETPHTSILADRAHYLIPHGSVEARLTGEELGNLL